MTSQYVLAHMGATASSVTGTMNSALPDLIACGWCCNRKSQHLRHQDAPGCIGSRAILSCDQLDGVATATACARFSLECIIYMGAEDVRRQALNVFRIRDVPYPYAWSQSHTRAFRHKDAVNDALWVTNLSNTHYVPYWLHRRRQQRHWHVLRFHSIPDKNVRLIGVEAGGEGLDGDKHSATLSKGHAGFCHGVRTYIFRSQTGQIVETHSIKCWS